MSRGGAVITNIAPNHLDIHGTMEAYVRAKENIYLSQGHRDFWCLITMIPLPAPWRNGPPGRVFYFSLAGRVSPGGAYLCGDELVYADGAKRVVFAKRSEISLLGDHNAANILAAAVASHLAGASWEAITEVSKMFRGGVPHRLEPVGGEKKGGR